MKIESYDDLAKVENNMEVDLSGLDPKLARRAIDFLAGLTCKKGSLTKIASHKYLVKIEDSKKYSYAKENTIMNLNNEDELKEFKDEYRKFLNELWDNIENNKVENGKSLDQGSIYSDPDGNNILFYLDLCNFLNSVNGKKYAVKYQLIDKEGQKFYSDQFGFSAPSTKLNHIYDWYLQLSQKHAQNNAEKDKAIDNVIKWVMESRTIGGSFIWPENIWKKYNTVRGGSKNSKDNPKLYFIEDRVDLTLLDIKHCLEETKMEHDLLYKYAKDTKWLDSFKSLEPKNRFKKYVDTFLFNDFVDENYRPYDIVNSNFARKEKIIIKEQEVESNKKNSIYNIDDLVVIERILNNVNFLINKRTERILDKLASSK